MDLKALESIATVLLPCRLTGEAQEVFSVFLIKAQITRLQSTTVLHAYEFVPQANQQNYCTCKNASNQTYVEFAPDKTVLFDKWCEASKVTPIEQLRDCVFTGFQELCV